MFCMEVSQVILIPTPLCLSPKVARLKNFIDTRRIFTGQVFPTRYDLDLAPCFRSGVPSAQAQNSDSYWVAR